MAGETNWPLVLTAAGFVLGLLSTVGGLVWKVSRVEKLIRDDMEKGVRGVDRDSMDRAETLRREAGEMGAALRTKVHDIEVFCRDTFVRKESFELVIGRIESSIERMGDKIDGKIDKLEENIDRAIERVRGGN